MGSDPPSIPTLAGWRCTRNDDGLQRQTDGVRGGEWEVYRLGRFGSGEIMSEEKADYVSEQPAAIIESPRKVKALQDKGLVEHQIS